MVYLRFEVNLEGDVKFRISILIVCLFLSGQAAPALSSESGGGEESKLKLDSRILGEERTLSVSLPPGYEDGTDIYPVLYVLDAESRPLFSQAVSTAREIHARGLGPEMIVVGIWNTNRNRDMIPASVPHRPGSGESKRFLSFIGEELIPYIKETYRTTGFSVLYGGSNAGLFTVYALLVKPETFDAYIASSPMVGHCPDFMKKKTGEFLRRDRLDNRLLYMIYGTGDSPRVTGFVPDFQKSLEIQSPEGFKSRLDILEGKGHVPPSSLSRGLRFVFETDFKRESHGLSARETAAR